MPNQTKDLIQIPSSNRELEMETLLAKLEKLLAENEEFQDFWELFEQRMLQNFILGTKKDVHKAYEYIQHYVRVRTVTYPTLLIGLRPSTTPLFHTGAIRPLKFRDPLGRLIFVDNTRLWDANLHGREECLKIVTFIMDEILRSCPEAFEQGVILLVDFDKFTFAQVRECTPGLIYRGLNLFVNAIPARYKGLHLINHGFAINLLMSAVKPLLKKKLRTRIHGHSKFESLHEHIPPSILPTTLGGHLSEEDAYDEEFDERIRSRSNERFYERLERKIEGFQKSLDSTSSTSDTD